MERSTVKAVLSCIVCALIVCAFSNPAYADEEETEQVFKAVDIDEDREMTLCVIIEADGAALAGARVSIRMVAQVYTKGYGVFYTALYGDYDYEALSASDNARIAAELSKALEGDEGAIYASTDADGLAYFEGLSAGIYLVELEEEYITDFGSQYLFDPYLVCVPLAEEADGMYEWVYEVTSYPKSVKYTSAEPLTGQDGQELIWGAALLAAACLTAIVTVIIFKKNMSGRKDVK